MIDIKKNYRELADKVKSYSRDITIITVSKTRSIDEIQTAIDGGANVLGENKVQEIIAKYEHFTDIDFHMIGHLQSNKVKYIIDKVKMIHSVDSLKLAKEIDKRAKYHNLKMNILIQINAGREKNKYGVMVEDAETLIRDIIASTDNVSIQGLMCVVPVVENESDAAPYFKRVKEEFDRLKILNIEGFNPKYLSMGMTNDYETAIVEGSNMIRVGSGIFGPRNYAKGSMPIE